MQPLVAYFTRTPLPDGTSVEANRNLDFVNSQHFVLSYDHLLTSNLRLKIETYYQSISNVAVESKPSSFSMLNAGVEVAPVDEDFLVNQGAGRNYGIELTLKRFFHNGYYFLLTTSLFDAKYTGSDQVQRNPAFNGDYIANLLGGKEFKIGSEGNTLNFMASGGNRYTPVDVEQSAALGYEVRQDDRAFSASLDDYLRADVKISYRINAKNVTHEFGLDLQNITNHQNEFRRTYNPRTNSVETQYQIGLFPVPQYRILFGSGSK